MTIITAVCNCFSSQKILMCFKSLYRNVVCRDYLIYHYCSDTSSMKFGSCSTSLSHRKLEVYRWMTGQNIILYQRWDQSFQINNNNNITRTQQVNIYVWGNGLYGEWCGAYQVLGSTLLSLKWVFLFLHTLPMLLEKVEKWPDCGMPLLYHILWITSIWCRN